MPRRMRNGASKLREQPCILSKKDAIEATIKAGVPWNHMKLTQAHDPKLDEGVLMWLKQARGHNLHVIGDLVKEKAIKLGELMHIAERICASRRFLRASD